MRNSTTSTRRSSYRLTRPVLRGLSILLLIAVIFIPELIHHSVPEPVLSSGLIEHLATEPPDQTLHTVATHGASLPLLKTEYDVEEVAQQLLAGTFTVMPYQAEPILLLPYPAHLKQGPPTLRLIMASLELERLLLVAFEKRGDKRLLRIALERIAALDRHERSLWLPDEFLWNDHALAARAGVLTRAWKHARRNPDVADGERLAIVRQVMRTADFLAKDSHFTVRTNHGVMQNLALLQLATAFPALPESAMWAQIAKDRLDQQLAYYVSPEGMVLEHSATYQQVGAELLARFNAILTLRGEQPWPALETRVSGAKQTLLQLWRPDGSLPVLGNTPLSTTFTPVVTDVPLVHPSSSTDEPRVPVTLMPVAGYTIWHSGDAGQLSQTVIAWAKHDGHGHKHADEMSLHFWRDGINWLTATGYWPYGHAGAGAAYGWRGANAPHLAGEAFGSPRSTVLLGHAASDRIKAIDLERTGPGDFKARRQIVQVDNDTVLILDFTAASTAQETAWTLDPRLALSVLEQSEDSIRATARSPASDLELGIHVRAENTKLSKIHGSMAPFGGWVVVDLEPVATDGLLITSEGAQNMIGSLFHLTKKGFPLIGEALDLTLAEGATADRWRAQLRLGGRLLTIGRYATGIQLTESTSGHTSTTSLVPPDASSLRASLELKKAFTDAINRYPPWRDLMHYRSRLADMVLALWLAFEIAVFAVSKQPGILSHRSVLALNSAYVIGGICAAYYLHFHYFR